MLLGPTRCAKSPGVPPASGAHFAPGNGFILEQFPSEILDKILLKLEPIWLFQLERAAPFFTTYLTSHDANPLWVSLHVYLPPYSSDCDKYQVLPASLYCSPECYQVESQQLWTNRSVYDDGYDEEKTVGGKSRCLPQPAEDISDGKIAYKITITENQRLDAPLLASQMNRDRRTTTNENEIGIPMLANCSALADEADANTSIDYFHRRNTLQYPLIKHNVVNMVDRYRPRNLALGGPYQESLSYRREILGSLHSDKRCDSCLRMSISQTRPIAVCGLELCDLCVKVWTVATREEGGKIMDIVKQSIPFVDGANDGWLADIHTPHGIVPTYVLAPLFDHVVRRHLGIDYRTAKAKELYLGRLRLFRNKETKLSNARRRVRLQILASAKHLFSDNTDARLPNALIAYWLKSFLPAARLDEVLFSPEALDQEALLLPAEDEARYPCDPTMASVRTCRQAERVIEDHVRIDYMAFRMLSQLLCYPDEYSRLVELASKYHIARLRSGLTLRAVQESSVSNSTMIAKHNNNPLQYTRRISTLLAKLCIRPDKRTSELQLDDDSKQAAIRSLPALLEGACIACPASGLVAQPGIEGVVQHVRRDHAKFFWGDQQAGSREQFFKIIG